MKFGLKFLLTVFAFSICLAVKAVAFEFVPLSEARLSVNYNAGKYISIDKDYSEIDLFTPVLASESSLAFLDLRGYTFFNDQWAGSVGVGFRNGFENGLFGTGGIIGANVYYDYFTPASRINFNQIGFGAEYITNCLEFRVNGYVPVGKYKQHSGTNIIDEFSNGFFATSRRLYYAYYGFDSEIGVPLFSQCDFNLYAAAGPYYYRQHDFDSFWGVMGRVELNWRDLVSLQVRTTYDRIYSTNVQGTIELRLPLSFLCSSACCEYDCCSPCRDLYAQPVRRNGIVLTDNCCNWTWNWNDEL